MTGRTEGPPLPGGSPEERVRSATRRALNAAYEGGYADFVEQSNRETLVADLCDSDSEIEELVAADPGLASVVENEVKYWRADRGTTRWLTTDYSANEARIAAHHGINMIHMTDAEAREIADRLTPDQVLDAIYGFGDRVVPSRLSRPGVPPVRVLADPFDLGEVDRRIDETLDRKSAVHQEIMTRRPK